MCSSDLSEISTSTFKPVNRITLLFTKVKVSKENSLSYVAAGDLLESGHYEMVNGEKICDALISIRQEKTIGVILNEVSTSYPKYSSSESGPPILHKDSLGERKMKQMIAEFAIFANTFIGEYLKINFNGIGMYRVCAAQEWLNTVYEGIRGPDLLNEIIVNGIKADYLSSIQSHDLVGAPEYCHFTSPIRRLSDCICHYLLKFIHIRDRIKNVLVPFVNTQLEQYANSCVKTTKSMKNIQYKDTKFRLIQSINHMLEKQELVKIKYYISSYTGTFLNIIICKINFHSVYISYTLRRLSLTTTFIIKEEKELIISKVNCMGKYDEGSIPELDVLFQ